MCQSPKQRVADNLSLSNLCNTVFPVAGILLPAILPCSLVADQCCPIASPQQSLPHRWNVSVTACLCVRRRKGSQRRGRMMSQLESTRRENQCWYTCCTLSRTGSCGLSSSFSRPVILFAQGCLWHPTAMSCMSRDLCSFCFPSLTYDPSLTMMPLATFSNVSYEQGHVSMHPLVPSLAISFYFSAQKASRNFSPFRFIPSPC